MYRIDHNDAIELEWQVRRLYQCERGGVSGMADADYFEGHPIQAAVLVVAYIYAKGLETDSVQYDEFLFKYETAFERPEDYDIESEVRDYINELRDVVNSIID